MDTYSSGYRNNKNVHLNVFNSYNDGDVVYSVATHKNAYVGGIIGNANAAFRIQNAFNLGFVGPESHADPASKARLGEIAGSQYADKDGGSTVQMKWSYYPNSGSVNRFVGSSAAAASAATGSSPTLVTFDNDGLLSSVVVVASEDCTNLLEALNKWVGTNANYLSWTWGKIGPEFVPADN